MTREEAIKFLKGYLDEEVYTEKCRNAHKMAIKALEQEPCEDAVSRQAALTVIKDWWGRGVIAIDDIRKLPPVTPTRKKGKWIKYEKYFIESDSYRQIKKPVMECSICRWKIAGFVGIMNYCPNCGAEMEGEK
jgi:hypothetical protein